MRMHRSGKYRKAAAFALTCTLLMSAISTAPISATAVCAQEASVYTPAAGNTSFYCGGVSIDYSNTAEGYIIAGYSGPAGKVKLQLTRSGAVTYTYNLNTGGYGEVFPLTEGNGSYNVSVYEHVYDNRYALIAGLTLDVSISNAVLPFLYPNQYVNFHNESAAVEKSRELAYGLAGPLEITAAVYNWVITNISYDYVKADAISSGQITTYLPSADNTLSGKKGICLDYAALMAAMLRCQSIPAKLQVGYVTGGIYHAWIDVYIDQAGWINGVIYFDGSSWKLMDPTFASNGGQSAEIMRFIDNAANYSAVYTY